MKIKGTQWYTAVVEDLAIKPNFHERDEGEAPTLVPKVFCGYRKSVQGKSETEIDKEIQDLKNKGVEHIELKRSPQNHTGIPAETPFLQVLDEKSVLALEKTFLDQGIDLPSDRYKEHGVEYINRSSWEKKSFRPKKSFLERLFRRGRIHD